MLFISVWLPIPKRQSFTYLLPAQTKVPQVGQLVHVPVGRRSAVGMVAGLSSSAPENLYAFKEIIEVLPAESGLSPNLLQLFDWARSHYLAPPGEVLRSFFPAALLKNNSDKGEAARNLKHDNAFSLRQEFQLNAEQAEAVSRVQSALGGFRCFLLEGITGSGKTEVYLRLCAEALARGEEVLVLVPEIGLTPQLLGRFVGRFGEVVAPYHSGYSKKQRLKTWWEVKEANRKIVVGTRSAVGLPFPKLGLIIVDEEHDPSYKQEERFRYHGRDMAVMRAKIENCPIVLGSATPALESYENVRSGKYEGLRLTLRATAGTLPPIYPIDLKEFPPHEKTLLSAPLQEKLTQVLTRGEQALFFLNRRGFAPSLLCRDCGEAPGCPNCSISLTYHKRVQRLKCHYCEYSIVVPQQCAQCAAADFVAIGAGTERLEEELLVAFPGLRLGRLDRDVATSRRRTEEILAQFAQGELDVLVGTQLVTKGHDFKRLTLVGILNADLTLSFPDFRAAERLYQLILQVAGRAGRHDLPGEVYLQTYRPEHYAVQAAVAQDAAGFYQQESRFRADAHYPPFQRLILLQLSGVQAARVQVAADTLAEQLTAIFAPYAEIEMLGPAKSLWEKLRGQYRWQILLRSPRFAVLRGLLERKLSDLEAGLPTGVRLQVDVDPVGGMI